MYNVIFVETYWNVWDKCRADDEIFKFLLILGQFMMKTGGDYFEYGGRSYGRVNYMTGSFMNFNQRQILLK